MIEFEETYKTAVIATCNITEDDNSALSEMRKNGNSRILEREGHGFIIKLRNPDGETDQYINWFEELSEELNNILYQAQRNGFMCVEIDIDGTPVEGAPTFEW